MIEFDQDSPQPTRARGFSPPAAVAILVGVTALSVVGSLGLGMAVFPTPPEGAAAVQQPSSFPDDVLIDPAPTTPAAPAPAPAAVATPSTPPAAPEPRPARPAPRARPGGASPAPAADETTTRQASRDDLGLDTGDPLGPIEFDRIEG